MLDGFDASYGFTSGWAEGTAVSQASDLATRQRRANSWIKRAAHEHDSDKDVAFILYWIAFDATYGKYLPESPSAEEQFRNHFERLIRLDQKRCIESALHDELSASVQGVLKNRYLYNEYWRYLNGEIESARWEKERQNCKTQAERAKKAGDTVTILNLLFKRLYTLRNQLLHGAATRKGGLNRDSVEHGARILKFLVPMFNKLMLDNPQEDWGPVWHPPGLQGKPRRRNTGGSRRTP